MTNVTTKRQGAKTISRSRRPTTVQKPQTTDALSKTDTLADLRARSQAIINNGCRKIGDRYHVEDLLAAKQWDDLAIVVDAIEQGKSYIEVVIRNDERTLSEDTIKTLCAKLAGNLEEEHLAGYFVALLDHLAAAAQSADVDMAVYTIWRHFLANSADVADKAAKLLKVSALAALDASGR